MDPFADLIGLLRPRATLWGRIKGTGRWSVSFRKRDDLLFCWVETGECQLARSHRDPVLLRTGDFVFIRTSSPFSLSSDPELKPQDSEAIVAATGSTELVLGETTGPCTMLRCGRFVFGTPNEALLWSFLPSLIHIAANQQISWRLRSLLTMNDAEGQHPGPGSDLVVSRLMELTLLELLRSELPRLKPGTKGLLSGLADPVIAKSLSALHREVAGTWTVAELARLSGVSRSTFATRFRAVMGLGPIEYLANWRIALAKDELSCGTKAIGEIALSVGFHSSSAFSTAFTRAVGCSPKRFATRRVHVK
ncbi:AraC family transcriptional regulator [Paludibaculum fermentans]|uniref:AraC family transcriptional regulator n=1 Tax=Paludibaculum fermentans TaxID=1473598 RepID=A0A7S7NV70_PALFE|nr:AraC family transcriptional regulator [Paludibaculum fermentans]QOY90328.1 AraC family transcriptional regulator [Paludibaculum fermentans]